MEIIVHALKTVKCLFICIDMSLSIFKFLKNSFHCLYDFYTNKKIIPLSFVGQVAKKTSKLFR